MFPTRRTKHWRLTNLNLIVFKHFQSLQSTFKALHSRFRISQAPRKEFTKIPQVDDRRWMQKKCRLIRLRLKTLICGHPKHVGLGHTVRRHRNWLECACFGAGEGWKIAPWKRQKHRYLCNLFCVWQTKRNKKLPQKSCLPSSPVLLCPISFEEMDVMSFRAPRGSRDTARAHWTAAISFWLHHRALAAALIHKFTQKQWADKNGLHKPFERKQF